MITTSPSSDEDALHSAHSAVEAYFRCWNDGNFELLDQLLADEWTDHSHPERRNAADVRRAFEAARAEDPNRKILIDAVLGQGELIEVEGRIVSGEGEEGRVWIVRTVNGRLHEIWTHAVD